MTPTGGEGAYDDGAIDGDLPHSGVTTRQVSIYFNAAGTLELKLCSSNVTYLNVVAVMEIHGFSVYDLLYHIENPDLGEKWLEMVESNAELQLIKRQIEEWKVLNLLVRACPPPMSQFQRQELSTIVYEECVVYEFSVPSIYVFDQEGIVFESQSSSSSATHGEDDNDGNPFYMGDADDIEMEEGKRQREYDEIEEEETYDEGSQEEEVVHYEGDIEVEELFQMDEDEKVVSQDENNVVLHEEKKKKKKHKLPVRRGPTPRSHSSVLEKEEPEVKPSSDEEEKGLLKEADDDGFEPLSFVVPKKRKSRAKQRPSKDVFKGSTSIQRGFVELTHHSSRNFKYHRNSDQRIIVECKQEHCNFFMVEANIKGETTFVIKKMRIEHTCPVSIETTRVSAKWLAVKYESPFRSDITNGIQTFIDDCMEKYGVDVPKSMAYRAKNLATYVVLGEHKKKYPKLRDYAQKVIDTNPGSRVVVTTLLQQQQQLEQEVLVEVRARRGAGRGAGKGAAPAQYGIGVSWRGIARGVGRGARRGAGKGSRAFYAPRQSAASTSASTQPSDGRHSGWRSYFYDSGNY
ncbi:hypothetical protein D1007_57126 [Hordeum vulgare]|nr:hypothetical protein D1007_57126 [Hordeum vulgare]